MDIVLATRNKKKAEELRRILAGLEVAVLTLEGFPGCPEVVEDRETFEGNAVKKAVAIAACTGKAALADDSGLEVDALNGAPGVYSARYAGAGADDAANTAKLLRELEAVPEGRRSARFVCCLALALPALNEETVMPHPRLYEGSGVVTFSATAEGSIAGAARGAGGFGYDPVFYPAGRDRTFAEMTPEEKDALSHRRKAIGLLKTFLKETVFKYKEF